jgi:transposase
VNGRRAYSAAAKQALAELCNRPGVSVAAMALQHGINANLPRRLITQYLDKYSRARHPTADPRKTQFSIRWF